MRKKWVSLVMTLMLTSACYSSIVSGAGTSLTTQDKFEVLKGKGIFTGFTDGSARLNEQMSREQFAAVLFRLMELKDVSGPPSYNDVLKTRWSYGEIEAVTEAGLMKGMGVGKFQPGSPVTVEQLATILVRAYGSEGSSNNGVGGKVSSWAKSAVAVAIDKGIIPIMYDYTGNATRGLLVDATYAAYQKMSTPEYKPLHVKSLDVISNTKIILTLDEPVSVLKPDNITIRKTYGSSKLIIRQATLSADGKKVEIVTDPQESATQYILTVDDTTKSFVSLSVDTTKPRIINFHAVSNYWLSITFSEPVDASSATDLKNYGVNNGLYMYRAELSNDGRTVTIQTNEQNAKTKYTFVAYNITDLAGNTLDPVTYTFGDEDQSAPTVKKITSDTNRVTLWFSERLDRDSAENVANYVINGNLGYPTRLDYNDTNQTVTLTTADQEDGKAYTLTLKNIKDLAGNAIKNPTKVNFTGVNNDVNYSLYVQSIRSLNWNTLEIRLNNAITANDLSQFNLIVNRDNGASVSMSGWQSYVTLQDSKTIRVQYRTADQSNPNLFREQHLIEASVYGLPKLNTRNNANVKSFAGTDAVNDVPSVREIKALDSRSVQVLFSKPVRNISKDAFILQTKDGEYVSIASESVNNRNKVVDSVVLYLDSPMQWNTNYALRFTGAVTDAAGWNAMKVTDGANPYTVYFKGIGDNNNNNNAAPRMANISSEDPYNIAVTFSEPVKNAAKGPYSLWTNDDRKIVDLKEGENATFEVSEDRTKLYIHLFADQLDSLTYNKSYKVIYQRDAGKIVDDEGKGFDEGKGANEAGFKAKGKEHTAPYIDDAYVKDAKLVLVFSEAIQGYSNQTNYFEIKINGDTITPDAGQLVNDKEIRLSLPKSYFKRAYGSITVTDAGADHITDINHVNVLQESVPFRIK
ncbi:hypothetical protein BVG16_00525 [Paenibacillus selenitireducens]|uniref:SLH domain-containing protein n=1 Tax=Paenibacillus selenitireducens TaxID=1324314 RepID=A0A1T2XLW5_9BACL|nr:Ig-like domain-containing protein [Paenibacillus selenitireducens]OPA80870.1 hypothetical protein BVG16_00525 [Paenibacillus selenitireducens]